MRVCVSIRYDERVYVRHWYIWESVWKVFAYDMRLCTRKVLNHKSGCKVLQGMRVYKALNVMIVYVRVSMICACVQERC